MDPLENILDRLAPELAVLEERRRHALEQRGHAWTAAAAAGVVAFAVAILFGRDFFPGSLAFAGVASVLLGALLHSLLAGPAIREFSIGFKSDLVRELVRAIAPGLDYFPTQGIPSEQFLRTQLFTTRPDRYRTEDLLTGRIGECPVAIAEIHAEERRTRRDSKGNSETYYVTIFQGILMSAEFPKRFHGVTRILPDNEKSLFAGIGKAIEGFFPFGSNDLVRLEDPEFETHFQVYSSDQVEARYLLSTSLMRRILDLRQTWGSRALRISFVDSQIHLAIPNQANFFEPNLHDSLLGDGPFQRIAAEIRSCLELVEQLNLETKIWSRSDASPP
jgi:hypothetical protein